MRILAGSTIVLGLITSPSIAFSQQHHPPSSTATALPTQSGQDAFAAISELVRILEADSKTDWSRVNLEAVRQHLIDMNQVVLRSAVSVTPLAGGAAFTISAPAPASSAITRMVTMHALELEKMPQWHAVATATSDGAVLTVTARSTADSTTVAKIRGLGFIGLLATGDHHREHHLALAKGQTDHGMHH